MSTEVNQCTYTGASFSLRNRIARVAWGFVWITLFRWSPRPLHAWRAFLLRCFGAKMGERCHIYPGVVIWAPWNLECADEVGVASGVTLYSMARITLGYRCVISQGSHLCSGTHDYEAPGFQLVAFPISVGRYAWVCAESFVGPGVSIGEGAVVGARSVVIRDMPAWMVCAGHPCRPIKERKFRPAEAAGEPDQKFNPKRASTDVAD